MSEIITITPEMQADVERLETAFNKHSTMVNNEIINLNYFCHGLTYLIQHGEINAEDLQAFDINPRTTSKGEHRHGMTKHQVENFMSICKMLNYLDYDGKTPLQVSDIAILEAHGLISYEVLECFQDYENKLSANVDSDYQSENEQLKATNQALNQKLANYHDEMNNIDKALDFMEILKDNNQAQKTILNQIKHGDGPKLSKEAFFNHYFELTNHVPQNLDNDKLLNQYQVSKYDLKGNNNISELHDGQTIPLLSTLNIQNVTKDVVINIVDTLYTDYKDMVTDDNGYLIDPLVNLSQIDNDTLKKIKNFKAQFGFGKLQNEVYKPA